MNNKLLFSMKKHTDILIEQTKIKPQETLEFKMNKPMQVFSSSPPINLIREGKWLLGVTSLECRNSVSNITNENNSSSILTPGIWQTESVEKTIDELNNLLKLRYLELHVKEVRKRGKKIKMVTNILNYQTLMLEKMKHLKN